MVELNVAASVLLDPLRRAEYDHHRAPRGAAPRACPPPFWCASPRVSGGWVVPPPTQSGSQPDGETASLLERLRSGAGRGLCAVGWRTSALSPREHLALTFASVCLACLLIASARPRSLPGFHPDHRERHALRDVR
jgi:hypothetical protein